MFITSKYKADQAAEIVADDAGRRAAADARRHHRRLRELRGRRRRAARRRRSTSQRIAGTDMLYSSGTTGRAEGRHARVRAGSRSRTRPPAWRRTLRRCCSASTSDSVYLSPAPIYHAAPLRFCMASQALGGTVVAMEHFDAEQYLALVERHQRHAQPGRADDVRAHAEAARGGRARSTTCRRCSASSTPPRRARSRSSSR